MNLELIDRLPEDHRVLSLLLVPFLTDGRVVLIREPGGRRALPEGDLRPGEPITPDAALRIPLMTAGFRMQHFHPFGIEGGQLLAWIEGDRYRGERPHVKADLVMLSHGDAVQTLRDAGLNDSAEIVEEAARSYFSITDEDYLEDCLRLLEPSYLKAVTPEGGSGFGGDSERWRSARQHIVDGIHKDGTFLDVGCANGYLMECVQRWAAQRGFAIEPYGLDVGERLVALARERYPAWADRIWTGNAVDWKHPDGMRFDFVHILLDLVRPRRRRELIDHLLGEVVAREGRLLVSHYVDPVISSEPMAADVLHNLGFEVVGVSRPKESRTAPTVWIDQR